LKAEIEPHFIVRDQMDDRAKEFTRLMTIVLEKHFTGVDVDSIEELDMVNKLLS